MLRLDSPSRSARSELHPLSKMVREPPPESHDREEKNSDDERTLDGSWYKTSEGFSSTSDSGFSSSYSTSDSPESVRPSCTPIILEAVPFRECNQTSSAGPDPEQTLDSSVIGTPHSLHSEEGEHAMVRKLHLTLENLVQNVFPMDFWFEKICQEAPEFGKKYGKELIKLLGRYRDDIVKGTYESCVKEVTEDGSLPRLEDFLEVKDLMDQNTIVKYLRTRTPEGSLMMEVGDKLHKVHGREISKMERNISALDEAEQIKRAAIKEKSTKLAKLTEEITAMVEKVEKAASVPFPLGEARGHSDSELDSRLANRLCAMDD